LIQSGSEAKDTKPAGSAEDQGARSPGCKKVRNPDLALTRANAMVARIESPDSGAIARLASGDEGKMT